MVSVISTEDQHGRKVFLPFLQNGLKMSLNGGKHNIPRLILINNNSDIKKKPISIIPEQVSFYIRHPVDSITKNTDYLIVGQQDYRVVGDSVMSSKQRKAFELKDKGLGIQILSEEEFIKNIQNYYFLIIHYWK